MPPLLLMDRRAMNVGSHLVPAAGSTQPWRMTDASESLQHLMQALVPDLRRSPAEGLRLLAHGNSGHLEFTADGLHEGNVRELSALRGLIHGTAQIHGCGVASAVRLHLYREQGIGNVQRVVSTPGSLDTGWATPVGAALLQTRELDTHTARILRGGAGIRFVLAFARALGLTTTAALHSQDPDASWRYEGPTVIASPHGALTLHVPMGDATFGLHVHGSYQVPF